MLGTATNTWWYTLTIYLRPSRTLKNSTQRYSQTRRAHPLAKGDSLKDGIALEKELLSDIREKADTIIDTTRFTVHELTLMMQSVAKNEDIFIPMGVQVVMKSA